MTGLGRRVAPWVVATASYLALTIYETWPLLRHLSDRLPKDLGDPVLNTWIIWWNAHAVPLTERWWNAPSFWPSTGSLAFSEVLLGLAPLTTPMQWWGWSPVAAYNVAFLITFPLSAIAAHALVFRLTGRHDAAVIGAVIYGFNPFRVAHFPQIQLLTSYWMPWALLGLHAYLGDGRLRWLVLFGVCWLMQAMSNGYYLLFFPVLIGLWLAWFACSRSNVGRLWRMAAAWALASLPLIPVLWKYRQIHTAYGFRRDVVEVATFGADGSSLVDASPLMKYWSLQSFHRPEGELFPGLTASILVALIFGHWLWTAERPAHMPKATLWCLAGSIVLIALALEVMVFGPWSITFGSIRLLSVKDTGRPLSVGVLLFAVAVALMPRALDRSGSRSSLMFYALSAGAMYLLAFGPQPSVLGEPFMMRGPYGWLMTLPGYDAIRVPARFAMLAVLCVAVVAGLAFARLTARLATPWRLALATVAVCGVLLDSVISELPLQPLPDRLKTLEHLPGPGAVLELPMGDTFSDTAAMYRGIYHGRPVVNGFSGFFPGGYRALRAGFDARDLRTFDLVTAAGPVTVVVDTAHDEGGRWAGQLLARPGATLIAEESGRKIFMLR